MLLLYVYVDRKSGHAVYVCLSYCLSIAIFLSKNPESMPLIHLLHVPNYRCIPHQQRALGTGIQFTMGKLFGELFYRAKKKTQSTWHVDLL